MNNKLNKKLAEWAGLELAEEPDSTGFYLFADKEGIVHTAAFTRSLDTCFKWLVPDDYQQIIFQPDGYCGLTVNDILYEGSGDTPALALCLAISKLINEDKDGK